MDGVNPIPKWEITGVLAQTNRCPRQNADPSVRVWLEIFPFYRAGHLWVAGGVGRQPAKYLAVMRLIESTAQQVPNG